MFRTKRHKSQTDVQLVIEQLEFMRCYEEYDTLLSSRHFKCLDIVNNNTIVYCVHFDLCL